MSERQITFASSERAEVFKSEVDELQRDVAIFFTEPGEPTEEEVRYILVSDESRFAGSANCFAADTFRSSVTLGKARASQKSHLNWLLGGR